MIRLLIIFIMIIALAAAFGWLADHPGSVVVHFLGKEIETSVGVVLAGILLCFVALSVVSTILASLMRGPRHWRSFWRVRKDARACRNLSHIVLVAGGGDKRELNAAVRHVKNLPEDEQSRQIVALQLAQLNHDRVAARNIFLELSKKSATALFGLRGLFTQDLADNKLQTAQEHAQKALAISPYLEWGQVGLLQVFVQTKQWGKAANLLERYLHAGQVNCQYNHADLAMILTEEALEWTTRDKSAALQKALKAHQLDAGLVPASLVAARLYSDRKQWEKSEKLIRETWAQAPHPDLASAFVTRKQVQKHGSSYAALKTLVKENDGIEGAIALAQAAVDAAQWQAARTVLAPYLKDQPQQRLYRLMARIEHGQGGHDKIVADYLWQALAAPVDPMWVIEGIAVPSWTARSPLTGRLARCQWLPPYQFVPSKDELNAMAHVRSSISTSAKPENHLPDDPGLLNNADGNGAFDVSEEVYR